MPENKKIEISQFNFYFITTIIGSLILGIGTWANGLNQQVSENHISMVQTQTILEGLNGRFEEFVELKQLCHKLESDLRLLQMLSEANARDLASRKGIRFNMAEYENYVKPVQEDVLRRIARLEDRNEK